MVNFRILQNYIFITIDSVERCYKKERFAIQKDGSGYSVLIDLAVQTNSLKEDYTGYTLDGSGFTDNADFENWFTNV